MSKGTFLEFQQMYRVLFKVQAVYLRLREEVDVQVVIKKEQQNYIIPHRAKLINGVATLNTHAQFFVSSLHPSFDIFVMIIHGPTKKFAGMCQVNLNQWQENSNNETTSILLKSPDTNAAIIFNFMYLTSDIQHTNKNLMSLGELESKKKSEIIKQVQDKYSFLSRQNDRLCSEVASLKQQNITLATNNEQILSKYTKNCSEYEQKMRNKIREVEVSEYNLCKMKEKMEKLEEMVKNYGEASLKEKMDNIIQQYQGK